MPAPLSKLVWPIFSIMLFSIGLYGFLAPDVWLRSGEYPQDLIRTRVAGGMAMIISLVVPHILAHGRHTK